jgi:lysophospholipase
VLHGTDTLAYTASALSFMLENLTKTVIITGSQIPLMELKNDAVDNLLGALLVAGHFVVPEVSIFFANKLLRGNRSTK